MNSDHPSKIIATQIFKTCLIVAVAFNQVNMVYALEVYQYGKFGFTNTDYILSKSTDDQSLI